MGLATLKGTEAVEDRSIDPIRQSLLSLEKKRSFKLTSTGTQPILEGSLFNIFNSFFHFFCDFFFHNRFLRTGAGDLFSPRNMFFSHELWAQDISVGTQLQISKHIKKTSMVNIGKNILHDIAIIGQNFIMGNLGWRDQNLLVVNVELLLLTSGIYGRSPFQNFSTFCRLSSNLSHHAWERLELLESMFFFFF